MTKTCFFYYLRISLMVLSGFFISHSALSQTVILPAPVHHLALQEGVGTIVADTITGAQLIGQGPDINWAQDDIKTYENISFIKSGANFDSQGVVEGALIQENLDQYTFTFLTRITDVGSGAVFRSLTDGMHFRFWNGTWDIAGGVTADASLVKINTWVRVSYVQTATHQLIYI
ncbi:MAG: hypothetical protein GY710_19500, partial [Desulfobacteraceae bacterium]|nr:hypothetical protein [Desulfobacteraceae bacterium]